MQQEKQLQAALSQKEILLAELFHRVKNNLNIVTSLLNLKKGSVRSEEAQTALEECRSLIFSMSLVHNKTYNSHKIDQLNFREYLDELGKELVNTLGGKDDTEFFLHGEDITLNISNAIPCGLIFNELITNSFKHGKVSGKPLRINVELTASQNEITFIYGDNGPGLSVFADTKNTLGLELMKSLCGQINAVYTFESAGGFRFSLKFKY
jgi:two-component sensor histidine kinase